MTKFDRESHGIIIAFAIIVVVVGAIFMVLGYLSRFL